MSVDDGLECANGLSYNNGLEMGQENETIRLSDLHDVPILVHSDSSTIQLEESESICPIMDRDSGLYTLKTKFAKLNCSLNMLIYRAKLDKIHGWASLNSSSLKFGGGSSFGTSFPRSASMDRNENPSVRGEARVALEVCNSVGLHCTANEEEVVRRLTEFQSEFRGSY
ncbi:hypothetical protein V6N13_018941 [Hibiscus sabdariffa]|uniref:Uncharacterized protein n=1 Tax=Hibiscus sabdariffa TaxID=183260 RepID=A0ABR2EKD3_9ROSI